MSADTATRYSPAWLGLREEADAQARSRAALGSLRRHLLGAPRLVIRDLGCGTGSMSRWLAGQLAGPQHWILHDHDRSLLDQAAAAMVDASADGAPVTVEVREGDVTRLTAEDLAGTSLVTASALLDVLTWEEVDALATACVDAGCAALLTLSVVGRVVFDPPDPLDAELTDAFNAHQRRETGGRRLLGPDAAPATAQAFARRGVPVSIHPGPWRLGPERAALTAEWLGGWVGAACEQRPELAERAGPYLRRRLAETAAGQLWVVVHHGDVVALPGVLS